ncbi:MAG: hypothetical protein IPK13_05130 [Deltaproteobacteria bacterium]|nr:hypothetical protein [Deltaproteobacteria bacterium]
MGLNIVGGDCSDSVATSLTQRARTQPKKEAPTPEVSATPSVAAAAVQSTPNSDAVAPSSPVRPPEGVRGRLINTFA